MKLSNHDSEVFERIKTEFHNQLDEIIKSVGPKTEKDPKVFADKLDMLLDAVLTTIQKTDRLVDYLEVQSDSMAD
jgi:hypothetical protein